MTLRIQMRMRLRFGVGLLLLHQSYLQPSSLTSKRSQFGQMVKHSFSNKVVRVFLECCFPQDLKLWLEWKLGEGFLDLYTEPQIRHHQPEVEVLKAFSCHLVESMALIGIALNHIRECIEV